MIQGLAEELSISLLKKILDMDYIELLSFLYSKQGWPSSGIQFMNISCLHGAGEGVAGECCFFGWSPVDYSTLYGQINLL